MQCYSGGKPTVGVLRFNSRTEKWENVGEFNRDNFAMQAGFPHFNIWCRNKHKLSPSVGND